MNSRCARLFLLGVAVILTESCGGGGGSSNNFVSPPVATPSAPTITSVSVTPQSVTLKVGASQQLTAMSVYSDASTKAATDVTWTSANPAIASVDIAGIVKGIAPGTVTVSAKTSNLTGVAQAAVQSNLPILDRSSNVLGPDANGNGVRDDIDQIIAGFPLTSSQKLSATQFAAALQATIVSTPNRDNAYGNAIEIERGQKCMASRMSDYTKYARQLHAYTFNTSDRVQAYIKFEQNIAGAVFPEVSGTICR